MALVFLYHLDISTEKKTRYSSFLFNYYDANIIYFYLIPCLRYVNISPCSFSSHNTCILFCLHQNQEAPIYKASRYFLLIQTRPGLCVYTKYSFGFCTKSHISLCTFQAVHDIFRNFSSKIVAPTATRLYDIIYCQLFIVSCICDFS